MNISLSNDDLTNYANRKIKALQTRKDCDKKWIILLTIRLTNKIMKSKIRVVNFNTYRTCLKKYYYKQV